MPRVLTFKRARTYAPVLIGIYLVAWIYELSSGSPPLYGDNVPIGGDYIAFHTAGRLLLSGQGAQLYDRPAVVAVEDTLLNGRVPNFYDGFRNPPFAALPFVPLALLDLVSGFAIWAVVSLGLLALALWLFLEELPSLKRYWRGLVILVFAFAPVYLGLIDGENSIVSLLLFVLIFHALRRGQVELAGVWAALGLFKPQLFVLFPIVFLARRQWRALLFYVVCGVCLSGVSVALVGWDGIAAWLRIVVEPEAGQVMSNTWRMVSLKSFLDALLPGQPGLVLLPYLAASFLLIGLVYRCWTNRRIPFDLCWIATSLVAVLVDPHLVDYDLAVLVPAGILAVRDVPGLRWVLVLLYISLVFRAHLPLLGDSGLQLSTLALFVCLLLTWRRLAAVDKIGDQLTEGESLRSSSRWPEALPFDAR